MRINVDKLNLQTTTVEFLDINELKNCKPCDEYSNLYCSYGEFFVLTDGYYRGLNTIIDTCGEVKVFGFNGNVLTEEEFNSRKK